MKIDKKLEGLREEMIHGVLKEGEFDESKKNRLLRKVNALSGTRTKKGFSFFWIGLSSAACLFLLGILILTSMNSNQMDPTPTIDGDSEAGLVDKQDTQDVENEKILNINLPNQEQLHVSIDKLQILKSYLEQFEDKESEIARIQTSYLNTINQKDYILVNYNCGAKLCNQLLLEHKGGNIKSQLISESSMFQTVKQNKNYLTFLFGRIEGSEVVRNQVAVINVQDFVRIAPPEDLLIVETFDYPIVEIEWEDGTLIATIPDIDDTSYATLEEWYKNNQESIRKIKWKIEPTQEKETTILKETSFTAQNGIVNKVALFYDGGIRLSVNDSQTVIDSNVSEDFLGDDNSSGLQTSYSLHTIGKQPFIVVVKDFPTINGSNSILDIFAYSDQNIEPIFSTSDMKFEFDAIDYEKGEVTFSLPFADTTVTYILTKEERANTEEKLLEFKNNNVEIDDEYIKSIKDGIISSPVEVDFIDNQEILITSNIESVGARTPVRIYTSAVFTFTILEDGIQLKDVTFGDIES